MTPTVPIGLIGYGALARQLVASLSGEPIRWSVLLREGSNSKPPDNVAAIADIEAFIASRPALVVEVAGQASVASLVPQILDDGIPVIIASVGALADRNVADAIAQARSRSAARLIVPSGAIGGLDYLSAISTLPGATVNYYLKKPPQAWKDVLDPCGITELHGPLLLYKGAPEDAATLFPKNTNAAFTVSAAVHPATVTVSVIADPAISDNIHEIEVTSAVGRAFFSFVNAPSHDNPKTSMVTALSIAAEIRKFLAQSGATKCPTS